MKIIEERIPYKPIKEETKERLPLLVGQIVEGLEKEIKMRDDKIKKLEADIKDMEEQLENLLDKKIRLENDIQNQIDEAVKDADAKHSHF
jgi:uncharacterized protein YoxC